MPRAGSEFQTFSTLRGLTSSLSLNLLISRLHLSLDEEFVVLL